MAGLSNDFPDFGLTAGQRRLAVRTHYYEWPGMNGDRGEIWCYSDRFSYRPGESVRLHVSSTAPTFAIAIVRDGATETKVFEQRGLAARWQNTPEQCSVEGCGWETAFEFTIEASWPSGGYRLTLTAESHDQKLMRYDHFFIVSPAAGRKTGRILQVAAR